MIHKHTEGLEDPLILALAHLPALSAQVPGPSRGGLQALWGSKFGKVLFFLTPVKILF
ncbi:MAG: hypothetical protein ACOVKR_05540 [Limnohabitans sp.]